jgi:sialic acid synthase SpsE
MLGSPIKAVTPSERFLSKAVRRSLCTNTDIKKGQIFCASQLEAKRPGTGISPDFFENVVGRIANSDIQKNEILTWESIGGYPAKDVD